MLTALVVLCWMTIYDIRKLSANRDAVRDLNDSECIVDKGWNEILNTYVLNSDLDSVKTALIWFTGFGTFFWALGFCVMLNSLRKLGKQ